LPVLKDRAPATQPLTKALTPGTARCEDVATLLKLPLQQTVKSIVLAVERDKQPAQIVLLLVRGDHELNEIKARKLPELSDGFRFASEAEIIEYFGCEPGYLGPIGLRKPVTVIADRTVALMSDFVCGANEKDHHFTGANWVRDIPESSVADIRKVVTGDASPSGKGTLSIARGIEVGHIFQLGRKYSAALKATVLDEQSKEVTMFMGCYGIGVTRVVAAAIEQNHDERGIIWPAPLAPFQVILVPLNAHKSERVRTAAETLYHTLAASGIEVLLDDRDARPGVKFADAELLGIPHRVVIGERGLDAGTLEYRERRATESVEVAQNEILNYLRERIPAE
jgi:prolyl-tRNA synthetase